MRYFFEDFLLDPHRRELRRGTDVIAIAPQVFDLLFYLIGKRERVVSARPSNKRSAWTRRMSKPW